MPFTYTTTGKKITSMKGSYGCPRWFDAVYSSDVEYIKKHSKNIGKVCTLCLHIKSNVTYNREMSLVTVLSITLLLLASQRLLSSLLRLARMLTPRVRMEPHL